MGKAMKFRADSEENEMVTLDSGLWLQMGLDLENRSFELRGEINDDLVALTLRALNKLTDLSPEPITIFLNSPGGSIYDGFAIYDLIVGCPCKITIIALGSVFSMAPIIMIAADVRVALPNTRFMVHAPLFTREKETSVDTHIDDVLEGQFCKDRIVEILAERTNKKGSWWEEKITRQDYYFDLTEAIEYGIITPTVKKRKKSKRGKRG